MKHHFGEMLDRSGGHWTIVPNAQRYWCHVTDVLNAPKDCKILTITNSDNNWKAVEALTQLEELTLHQPSHEQIAFLTQLKKLKRLRITHARLKSLDFLSNLAALQEVILEYVSGVEDLKPLATLPSLTALHLENLRQVHDFSGLAGAKQLRYLSIDGTMDWKQPVDELGFLSTLKKLEYFRLWYVRVAASSPVFRSLVGLSNLKKLIVMEMTLALEDYAHLEAMLPEIRGATFAPYEVCPAEKRTFDRRDLRAKMPVDQLSEQYPEVLINDKGERYEEIPEYTFCLGLRGKTMRGSSDLVLQRRQEYAAKYHELVKFYRSKSIT